MLAFVADYEHARGQPFTKVERDALDAANLAAIAYGARCQHSDNQLRPDIAANSHGGYLRLLKQRGPRLFSA